MKLSPVCPICFQLFAQVRSPTSLRNATFFSSSRPSPEDVANNLHRELPPRKEPSTNVGDASKNFRGSQDGMPQQRREKTIEELLQSLIASNRASPRPQSRSRYSRSPLESTRDELPIAADQHTRGPSPHFLEPRPDPVKTRSSWKTTMDAPYSKTVFKSIKLTSVAEGLAKLPEENPTSSEEAVLSNRLLRLEAQLQQDPSSIETVWSSCLRLLREVQSSEGPSRTVFSSSHGEIMKALRGILISISLHGRVEAGGQIFTPASIIEEYKRSSYYDKNWLADVLWAKIANFWGIVESSRNIALLTDAVRDLAQIWRAWAKLSQGPAALLSVKLSREPQDRREDFDGVDVSPPPVPKDSFWSRLSQTADGFGACAPEKLSQRMSVLFGVQPGGLRMEAGARMTLRCYEHYKATGFADQKFLKANEPFSILIQKLLHGAVHDTPSPEICLRHAGVSQEKIDALRPFWTTRRIDAIVTKGSQYATYQELEHGAKRSKPEMLHREVGPMSPTEAASIMVGLDRAAANENAGLAQDLWHKAQSRLDLGDTEACSKMFAKLLVTFFAVRRAGEAISVWNHMIKVGHRPDHIHWNAMLNGSLKARDLISLRQIWTNMLQAKLKPDIILWTTYISGLIKLGKHQLGLEALEQLGRAWKPDPSSQPSRKSNQKPIPESEKLSPSLAPINAALAALVDTQKHELTPTVISWARSQNIPLSTHSHNTLLRPIVRKGDPSAIQNHLTQMLNEACPPDIGTYTIILNGLLSNPTSHFRSLPQGSQTETVLKILSDMSAQGIDPNARTYATILDGLLDENILNIPAARHILAEMAIADFKPSPHVYTILLTHYFASTPPDLPAVESLWTSIQHTARKGSIDLIFYDRIIEGYADHDQVEKASSFLRRMAKEGKSPGWIALGKILGAMERAEEWEMCESLVKDVEDTKAGLLRFGEGRNMAKGKERFWDQADALRARGLIGSQMLTP